MQRKLSFLLIVTLTIFLAACGTSSHTTTTTPPGTGGGTGGGSASAFVSLVYTAGASSITGYQVNANGTLTPATGSPFASTTNNSIVTNGSNVYVIDGDSVTLKILALNKSNGQLTQGSSMNAITGNPNTGDIAASLALDHSGSSLYASEANSSGDDGQQVFTVGTGTTATQIEWEGGASGSGSEQFGPPLVFSPDNRFAYTGNCYHLGWSIFEFPRASNGTLTFGNINGGNAGGPAVTDSNFPCPEAFSVSAQGYMAVAYFDEGSSTAPVNLTTYHINADGTLTAVTGSLAPTASSVTQNATVNPQISIGFDPTGTLLAVVGNGGVQTFSLSSGGMLTAVSSPQNAGVLFQNVGWDKSNHLFATGGGQLYVYNSSNGQLTSASGSPMAGGAGLTVLPLQ